MLIRPGQCWTDTNAGVLLVRALRARGYCQTCSPTPAAYGPAIVKEVKRFQAQHPPLIVDGVVGPKTWAMLTRPADDDQRQRLGRGFGRLDAPADPRIPCEVSAAGSLLKVALADYDAGRRETPMGSNICPWLEPRAQGKPWCSFQVHAWIRSVLGKWIFGGRRGSTRMDLKMARMQRLIVSDPRPGDVFLLCDAAGRPYHTGLLLRVDLLDVGLDAQGRRSKRPYFNTIEGNCANRVAVRERPITPQVVFWRPFPGELAWTPGLLPNVKRAGGESTR